MDEPASELTGILEEVGRGSDGARERLLELVYAELHRLAAAQMRGERVDHTLQPTALVHEAYVRLLGGAAAAEGEGVHWENRRHFYATAAEVMRRLLVDHAREKAALRRGGDRDRVPLLESDEPESRDPAEILRVDEALARLGNSDPEASRLVELRFFAGMKLEEIAKITGASVPTLKRRWRYAKAWLYREIRER